MSTLYELYSKRTKYKLLKENVSNAINVLSRNNSVDDSIDDVESVLNNNYLVNESICKGSLLKNIKQQINSDLKVLESSLSSIIYRIDALDKEIQEKEAEQ